jgi:hypothetical protein
MPLNEWDQDVPEVVARKARELGCRGGVKYVYRDGDYSAGRWPATSINCGAKAARFQGPNCDLWKVPLGDGWVAFECPQPPPKIDYDPASDPWVTAAAPLVEECIDELVQEFFAHPYLHRVEHSIHAHLIDLIRRRPHFLGLFPIGETREETQLIHKEWPETSTREGKPGRGNFDIAILSPRLLKRCTRIPSFAEGWLPAPIVIEMGLNYSLRHYEQDRSKLINSKVYRGYLIHLLRGYPEDTRETDSIQRVDPEGRVKTAFARTRGRLGRIKLLNETEIKQS